MNERYFYNDPRLLMTPFGRFAIRFITIFSYTLLVVLVAILVSSEDRLFRAVGLLIGLFLLDRLAHLGRSEYFIFRADGSFQTKRAMIAKYYYNIARYVSPLAHKSIEAAVFRTRFRGGNFYLHLLSTLISRRPIARVLVRLDVSPKEFLAKLEEYIKKDTTKKPKQELYKQVSQFMEHAFDFAVTHYGEMVTPRELFGALTKASDPELTKLFALFSIEPGDLESAFLFAHRPAHAVSLFAHRQRAARARIMNRAWTARPTPLLDRYSEDVTARVRAGGGGFLIGHKDEYERLVAVLGRPGDARALLVGEAGVGKRAVVDHLAFQLVKDRVPRFLFDKRLVSLSLSDLVSGASDSEASGRISKIVKEIIAAGNVILYIPDIHRLTKATGEGHLSGVDVLIPAITQGRIPVIGGTYPTEYARDIEQNSVFKSSFETIRVSEISNEEATRYLVYIAIVLELKERVTITFGAIKRAVSLSKKHLHETPLPGSAESLLTEAVSKTKQMDQKIVTPEIITKVVEERTNVILHEADKAESETLLNLEEVIHERFIDQEQAVSAVSRSLREYRSGLSSSKGPIASFLFVGPTGVGKTELSKIVADIQFGSDDAMVRLDMSEYQGADSLERLIGSADGKILGSLTEAVRTRPYVLLLLDEFEKADKDILHLFLQVLDDGRLTDGLKRTIDFSQTIIVATSNAYSTLIQEKVREEMAPEKISMLLRGKLTDYFTPELLNRFSQIVVFKSLSKDDVVAVTRLLLKDLITTASEAQGIELVFEESAVLALSRLGYDPEFGARPLRRVIEERVRSVLAEKVLRKDVSKGDTVRVLYRDEEFVFE